MRKFINIVESTEPDITKIAAEVRREIENHASEMPFIRAEYGLEPYADETDDENFDAADFEAFIADHCETAAFDAYMNVKRRIQNGYIEAWRVITAPQNWTPEGKHVGIYWSWDEHAAEAHWGEFHDGHVKWKIHARLPEDSIDWEATILMGALSSYSEEKEVRIFENAPVEIVGYKRVK